MKRLVISLVSALFLIGIVGCSGDAGTSDDKSTSEGKAVTIKFGITPWTSTVPPTKIASLIVQEMGYDVEEVDADAGSVYTGLSRGDINVFMDSWIPAHQPYLDKYADTIDDTAISYDGATAGWVVPTYMEDINSYEDIKGKEDIFGNEMYSIEEGTSASETIDELIETYDLDIEQVHSSEGAMMAMAIKKMDKEEPVIFYGWRPHTMFNKFDIKTLEDPKEVFGYESSIHVITNNDLQESAPDVYEFLSNWSISIDDMEEMIAQIDDGANPDEVAQEWIDNNEDKIKEMMGE